MLTPQGLDGLKIALAPEQVGFIEEKLELLALHTTFDPLKRTGQLPINTSLIDKDKFKKALAAMGDAFKAGMCVSGLVAIASEGERLGSVVIPSGKIGLATVCSVVINGVLLKASIPVESRFVGVLEIRDSKSRRFVAIINYSGMSLDPSEQYICARMTKVSEAARTGNGKVLISVKYQLHQEQLLKRELLYFILKEAGIRGVRALGNISEPVCQVAVGQNRVCMVLLGGLNPVAAAFEAGIEVENIGESRLINFEWLNSFWQL